ncbi:patatin-like phospholipase family protein [Limnobacter parvus]|uniref:patatin-like phospholipase family protein n=1 Tax=Limnobacter parvus TaxID=2939690 RepID=UPI00214AD7CF|nr:patatin-like phospholipase family protein [Limnobacter parvus]
MSKKLEVQAHEAEQLVQFAKLVHLPRGETLFHQGEPSHHFYLLLQGQLKGLRVRPDGQNDLALSFFPGEMIGELGFFDQAPRTVSIAARRESVLLEIDQTALEKFGKVSPSVYHHLIRMLVSRFKRELGYSGPSNAHQFVLFQSFVRPEGFNALAVDSFYTAMGRHSELRRWKHLGDIPLGESRKAGRRVVEIIETEPLEHLDDRLIETIDCMVVMLCASTLHDMRSCELLKAQLKSANDDVPVWFVLVHEAAWVEQAVVERIRDTFGFGFKLLHVRRGHHADNARVVRHILGLTLGLVLGGGGARGFAHAGFFQALEEAGVVLDSVGGTSMGALVGALIATGNSAAEVNKVLASAFRKGLPFKLGDYWIPKYGFVKSKAVDELYQNAFGDSKIEDQPIPFFAISCNLTTGNQHLFEHGPLWKAVRASTSIPVFFEPFMAGRDVMVDGALVNNVPVDCMRARGASKILTVDVGLEEDITAHMVDESKVQMPSMMKSLMRVIELGGIEKSRQAKVTSDLYVQPSIEKIGLMEFERREEIIALGYEAGRKAIPDILGLTHQNT